MAFTGFDEDSFLLPCQSFGSMGGRGGIDCQEPSVPEEWHNNPTNIAWKSALPETKVTEANRLSVIWIHDPNGDRKIGQL